MDALNSTREVVSQPLGADGPSGFPLISNMQTSSPRLFVLVTSAILHG